MENFLTKIKQNKILAGMLVAVFLASIAYSFYFRIQPVVDAAAYDVIAWNLASGQGYRENLAVDIQYDYAIARVGPLYEFLLAGIYFIFGHHFEPVWILQALMRSLSALLLYLLCLRLFDFSEKKKLIGLLAVALFGFYPDLIEISAMLMIETTYLFLMILTLYLFFRFFDRPSRLGAAVLGIAAGAAVLLRPPVLFLTPVIFFYFIFKKQWLTGLIFLTVFTAVFIPWTARNYRVYGEFMPLGAAGGYNLWIGNHPGATGEQEQPMAGYEFIATRPIKDLPELSSIEFRYFVLNHPGEFLKITLLRVNKYFSIIRPMGFWFYQKGWSQFALLVSSVLASAILFIFGFGGAWQFWRAKREKFYYFLAFTLLTPPIILLTVVETRYRFQIYPFLTVAAAFFFSVLSEQRGILKNKALQFAIFIIFLNGAVDAFLNMEKIKEKLGLFF